MQLLQTVVLTIALTFSCQETFSQQAPCQEQLGSSSPNKSLQFSMIGTMNLTGHWKTQFKLKKESTRKIKNWKLDVEQRDTNHGGTHTIDIKGVLTVPPPRPSDYELFPGIGYYKFHHKSRVLFNEAASICANEGGHLIIINSEEETNVIQILYARHKESASAGSHIGYYDPLKNRNFVTILGESLNSTGYTNWKPTQPDNIEKGQFCVYIWPDGKWADEWCNIKYSFFCEYDLSWGEI